MDHRPSWSIQHGNGATESVIVGLENISKPMEWSDHHWNPINTIDSIDHHWSRFDRAAFHWNHSIQAQPVSPAEITHGRCLGQNHLKVMFSDVQYHQHGTCTNPWVDHRSMRFDAFSSGQVAENASAIFV
jgi:hypothetical protein